MFCAYARDTELKINHENLGNENLFALYLIWWHTHTYMYLINWNYKKYKKKVTVAYIC